MLLNTLLVAHIAVLGYWLGSELVINSNFRFLTRASGIPFAERDRLFDHVLDVDQHVRYALILQAGLGTALAALLDYIPGGNAVAIAAGVAATAWLALVEATHRQRKTSTGRWLGMLDGVVRYSVMLVLLVIGVGALAGAWPLAGWLALKLSLFAGVILCGLGIRLAIIRYYQTWRDLEQASSTPAIERELGQRYWNATAVLILLWLFIAGIVALSLLKP